MARCPNCGRQSVRTKDWSCRWCGYPLFSRAYKKIDKTYRELKRGTPFRQPVVEEAIPGQGLKELKAEPAAKPGHEPEVEVEAEEEPVSEPEPVLEAEAEVEAVPNTEEELTPEPEPVVMEMTVDELLSVYETEGKEADKRFANQILRIKGPINKIEARPALNIYYISLVRTEKDRSPQSVRCVFGSRSGRGLGKLTAGQTVTVQGRYEGTITDVSLRDCSLVR